MSKEEKDMLQDSLNKIVDKIDELRISSYQVRLAIGKEHGKLAFCEPVWQAIKLSKFRFIDRMEDFNGEDLELLSLEDKTCWEGLLREETIQMKQIAESSSSKKVYESIIRDIEEEENNLVYRRTELEKKLHARKFKVQGRTIDLPPVNSFVESAEICLLAMGILGVFLLGSGWLILEAGEASGAVLLLLGMIVSVGTLYLFLTRDSEESTEIILRLGNA